FGKIGIRTWRSNVSFRNLKIKTGENDWENIAFDGSASSLGMWDILKGENSSATFSTVTENAFNGSRAAKIQYVSGSGKAGLTNAGLNRWGIAVKQNTQYDGRIYLRGDNFAGAVHIALQSADGQTVYAEQEIANIGSNWQKYPFSLTSNATDNNARFAVWVETAGTLYLDQAVLEGTGEERFQGLPYRADIGNMLVAQGLNFMRYGGTMVNAAEYRFKKMIGDPDLRPPYRGHWYEFSTNGFGIEDFLKVCEAAGFEAAFAINVEETAQDAADMIEYLNGDISTVWGAKRAENGHPAPYNVKYIEIGNEEVIWGDVYADYTHYIERFLDLYNAMKAKDPNLKFINSAWWRPESANMKRVFDALNGKADYWDYHPWTDELNSAQAIATEITQMKTLFKQWDVNTTMKCAIFEENGNLHNVQRAVAHASILNTVRRLGDFVLTSCVANALQPYHQNDNGWDQGQIFFTPSQVYGQPTFYVQQMAANNHLPLRVAQSGRSGVLDITATTDENRQTLVIHVVNTSNTIVNQAFTLQNFVPAQTAQVTVLQGNLSAENTPENPENIVPQTSQINIANNAFTQPVPPRSYTVIRIEQSSTGVENIKKKDEIELIIDNGQLIIENEELKIQELQIFDLTGRTVEKMQCLFSTSVINISQFPQGIYLLKIKTDKGTITQKFVKK
ncbi:MAG: T9SS type A sorting domain-containing protein, partial [Paludibacter sp.]|nr:T9SS type A sorting domain-containing protein [Paludibacter sp.]